MRKACDTLRAKVLALVWAAQKDPLAAQKQAHEIALAEAERLNSGSLMRRIEAETASNSGLGRFPQLLAIACRLPASWTV